MGTGLLLAAVDAKLQQVVDAGRSLGLEVEPRTFSAETRTAQDAAREPAAGLTITKG